MTLRFGGRALGTTLPMAAGGLVTRHPQMGTVERCGVHICEHVGEERLIHFCSHL
jgi:hypothetical protein